MGGYYVLNNKHRDIILIRLTTPSRYGHDTTRDQEREYPVRRLGYAMSLSRYTGSHKGFQQMLLDKRT